MMAGLRLFTRTSERRCWNIASYHSPHSLTWSWVLSFSFFKSDERRVRPLWWAYPDNSGSVQWGVRVPFIGMLIGQRQRPMWYRDLYCELRDERDRERYEASLKVAHISHKPTVIEGGRQLH